MASCSKRSRSKRHRTAPPVRSSTSFETAAVGCRTRRLATTVGGPACCERPNQAGQIGGALWSWWSTLEHGDGHKQPAPYHASPLDVFRSCAKRALASHAVSSLHARCGLPRRPLPVFELGETPALRRRTSRMKTLVRALPLRRFDAANAAFDGTWPLFLAYTKPGSAHSEQVGF